MKLLIGLALVAAAALALPVPEGDEDTRAQVPLVIADYSSVAEEKPQLNPASESIETGSASSSEESQEQTLTTVKPAPEDSKPIAEQDKQQPQPQSSEVSPQIAELKNDNKAIQETANKAPVDALPKTTKMDTEIKRSAEIPKIEDKGSAPLNKDAASAEPALNKPALKTPEPEAAKPEDPLAKPDLKPAASEKIEDALKKVGDEAAAAAADTTKTLVNVGDITAPQAIAAEKSAETPAQVVQTALKKAETQVLADEITGLKLKNKGIEAAASEKLESVAPGVAKVAAPEVKTSPLPAEIVTPAAEKKVEKKQAKAEEVAAVAAAQGTTAAAGAPLTTPAAPAAPAAQAAPSSEAGAAEQPKKLEKKEAEPPKPVAAEPAAAAPAAPADPAAKSTVAAEEPQATKGAPAAATVAN